MIAVVTSIMTRYRVANGCGNAYAFGLYSKSCKKFSGTKQMET